MFWSLTLTRKLARLLPARPIRYASQAEPTGRPRVLVAGVYVANKANTVEHLVAAFAGSRSVEVEQRWAAVKGEAPTPAVAAVTTRTLADYLPKWTLLGELIGNDADRFDYVVFCDDDIRVGDGFLDRLIALQQRYDLALAQPARTWASFTDWPIVRRRLFTTARETRYVESGPCVSMRRDFLKLVLPFSEESPMGWGYDLVWPVTAADHGMRLGVIDAVPVDHSLRPRGILYAEGPEMARMSAYLASRRHITEAESQRTVRTFR